MIHLRRFTIGAADLLYRRFSRKHPLAPVQLIGQHKRKSLWGLACSLLVLVAFILAAALILPLVVPAASSALSPLGADGLAKLVGAACLAWVALLLFKLGGFLYAASTRAYARGLAIERGERIAAWHEAR